MPVSLSHLTAISYWLLQTAPQIPRVRLDPGWEGWGDRLRALGQADGLEPIRPVLAGMVADGFREPHALNRFLTEQAVHIPYPTYLRASDVALSAVAECPFPAFVLSLVSVLGFTRWFEHQFEQSPGPYPHQWEFIPYACAHASVGAGAFAGAKRLVEFVYEELDSYRPQQRLAVRPALDAFRLLGRTVERRYESAIANLAEDLRESCRPGAETFRPEVGAMTWTLGMVPESRCFRRQASSPVVPSRRFFRQIVRQSLACIPDDPLVQHVWLELKDRGPFNLRGHESLFTLINTRYHQSWLDEVLDPSPSKLYARNLVDWFRGSLDRACVTDHLTFCSRSPDGLPGPGPVDAVRHHTLAALLAREIGLVKPGPEPIDVWYALVERATRTREDRDREAIPLPLPLRGGPALFYLIEQELSAGGETGPDGGRLGKLLGAVERYCASTLFYWTTVVTPRPTTTERQELGALLQEEEKLLGRLRGYYFEMMLPTLPQHYWYYGGSSLYRADPKAAPERFRHVLQDLHGLHARMREAAPTYIEKRAGVGEALTTLVRSLSPTG